ncbi:HAD family hydrolase [Helcococcus kunzii]
MEIKCIALDMDGTLLIDDQNMLESSKLALLEAQKKGIKVILASGRPIGAMKKYIDILEFEKYSGFLISNNGALVYDCKNKEIIAQKTMNREVLKKIIEKTRKYDLGLCTIIGDTLFTEDINKGVINIDDPEEDHFNFMKLEAKIANVKIKEVESMLNLIDQPIVKLFYAFEEKYINKYEEEIFGEFRDMASISRMGPNHLEIVDKEVNKGVALKDLGFKSEEIIAFGDSINDYFLLKYAKYGIAMDNAVKPLKEVAFEITDDYKNHGIYNSLVKHGVIDANEEWKQL